MSTSPHGASDRLVSDPEFDLLAHEDPQTFDVGAVESTYATRADLPFDQYADDVPGHAPAHMPDYAIDPDDDVYAEVDDGPGDPAYVEDSYEPVPSPPRRRVTVYESLPGMPGRGVVLLTVLATVLVAVLDFALTGRLSYFFDLSFVVICLVAAMGVRGHDLFTTGVLPPLVFGLVVATVAMTAPATIVPDAALGKVFLTGLTDHAAALVFGYGIALVTVAGRAAQHRRR